MVVTYTHMLDVVNKRLEEVEDKDAHETLWFLESIVGHRLNHDKKKYSVKVRWSTNEETWEEFSLLYFFVASIWPCRNRYTALSPKP